MASSRDLRSRFVFKDFFPVRQYCYSEDGKVVLGRVFVFHGIKFTVMVGEMGSTDLFKPHNCFLFWTPGWPRRRA